jgi:hypothetical protein
MGWFKKLGKVAGKIAGVAVGAGLGLATGGLGGALVGGALGLKGSKKLISATGGGGDGGDVQMPSAPTFDAAAQNQQVADRIKRRRGVLANLYGGKATTSSPLVATKQLLGS